jgi:NitT/TauT family transport system ATP-binding protein
LGAIAEPAEILSVERLGMTYGSGAGTATIIRDLSFTVPQKEFICVVGPSGVGKTTLVRCIAGLQRPTEGSIRLEGSEVRGPSDGVAFVSQDYVRSLMPWLRIRENVMLPLKGKGIAKSEMAERARIALEQVGLGHASRNYPWELSGGMQQRVSIARALAYRPHLLIMDEPFASVDAQTRADLEDLMLRLQHETGVTTVLITHDIDTSIYMADRVMVLGGRPATVIDEVETGLGNDRDQIGTKASPRFLQAREHVLRSIQYAQERMNGAVATVR